MLLALGLRNNDDDPAGMAVTTLMLIVVRNMLRALHKLPALRQLRAPERSSGHPGQPSALRRTQKALPPGGERGQGSLPAVSGYALAHLIRRYIARFPC
jgi:hypothetical protein